MGFLKNDYKWKKKKENSLFSIHNPVGVKLLTRLRVQLSHLNESKFRHGFEDTISPICSCNTEIKSKKHFLLCCHLYSSQRIKLFDNLNKVNSSFFKLTAKHQVNILSYGYSSNYPISLNEDIIKLVFNFLIKSGHYDQPLIRFNQWMWINVLYTRFFSFLHQFIDSKKKTRC